MPLVCHAWESAYLVNVDLRLPLLVAQKVEAPHTDLTKVTRVVLVEVGSVVVLTTGHTTTTGVLENEDRASVLPISRIRLL